MNLQINFIQPAELRSASIVSLKSLVKIASVMLPLIVIILIVLAYVGYAEQKSSLGLLEDTWKSTEARQQRAQALGLQLEERKSALEELKGWSQSRPDWYAMMGTLSSVVPPVVQLKVLQARQALEVGEDGYPQRTLRIVMNGRCEGPDAEDVVEMFRRSIAVDSQMSDAIRAAQVAAFREDTETGSTPDDRTFQVEVDFIPRSIHATTPE